MSAGRKPTLYDLERLCQNLAALNLPTESAQDPAEFAADECLLDMIAGRSSGLESNVGSACEFADIWQQTFETMTIEFLAMADEGQLPQAIEGLAFIAEQAAIELSPYHDLCLDAFLIGGVLKLRAGELNESLRTLCDGLKLAIAAKGSYSKIASCFLHEIDALPLPLSERLSMLSQFARTVDRHHQLDICYGDVSRGKMYATYLDAIVMTHGSKAPGLVGNLILDESPSSMIRLTALSVPADRFISKEIQLLGQLLVTILNNSATNEHDSELPWWKRLSNAAVVVPLDIPDIARLRSIITLALEQNPHRQIPTAGEFADAIDVYLRGEFMQYNCDARRLKLLAWRAGFAFGKFDRQLKLLQDATSAMPSMANRSMDAQVLTLARNAADSLIDVRELLIDLPGPVMSREAFEITENCKRVSQWITSAEIAALHEELKTLIEWWKQLLEQQTAYWRIADWIASEVFSLALNADVLVQDERVEVQRHRSDAIEESMQKISERIQSAAQASRGYSDVQVRAAILNREMVRYFRWSVIDKAQWTLPKNLSGWDNRADLNLFDGLINWTSHWHQWSG